MGQRLKSIAGKRHFVQNVERKTKRIPTIKVYVQHVSLETMQDAGWELGDDGFQAEDAASFIQSDWVFKCLTKRQREVATCLAEGYTRRETAKKLHVSLQAIHQIVPRMRDRIRVKGKVTW